MSTTPWKISIAGTKEFSEEITRLTDGLYDDETVKVYLAAAKVIADEAKRLAPRGKHPAFVQAKGRGTGYEKAPGRLRKAIVARTWRQGRDARRRYGPGAYVQVNLKRRGKNITAPYGHIVAGGRRPSTAKKGFFFWREGEGQRDFVKTRQVKGYAGRDYFQRAVASTAPRVLERAAEEVKRQVEKRYR